MLQGVIRAVGVIGFKVEGLGLGCRPHHPATPPPPMVGGLVQPDHPT